MNTFIKRLIVILALAVMLAACNANSKRTPLSYEIFNPLQSGIFPVTSTIFYSKNEALLVDAQFTTQDAQQVVNKIKASGKPLTLIYISHSDPDYYFGLTTILEAFPNAKIIASVPTTQKINATIIPKLKYWAQQVGNKIPHKISRPSPIQGNYFLFGNHRFEIRELKSPAPDRSYVWVPNLKMIVGGPLVSDNIFPWTADTKTFLERDVWKNMLDTMLKLNPKIVIPGHYLGQTPFNSQAILATKQYLNTFDIVLSKSHNANDVIQNMTKLYPNLEGKQGLEMSAKIIFGEMEF